MVIEIYDGTHQVRSEITVVETVIGDFTTNKYIVANYTFDNTATTEPVFSISATAGTGNTICIGKVTDDTVDVTGFDYSEAPLKQIVVQGGNSSGADFVVGTDDNFDLHLKTNGVTRIDIDKAGAVTTSSTVNGRSMGTDGTKLDGIEAGATADQSNAEIKTAYEANANTNEFSDAEQTKLAGIETAATADQTASEILTAIKTVDGTGTGLDADLLDGLHATSFLRSDQAITPFSTVDGRDLAVDGAKLDGIDIGSDIVARITRQSRYMR